MTLSIVRKAADLAVAAFFTAGIAAGALAATHAAPVRHWQANHPRRVEVNHRLERQSARIHWERKEGKITQRQAMALHRDDWKIRREERVAARMNGGHITSGEQSTFNRQENAVNKQIRGDSTSGGGSTTTQK